VEPFCRRPDRQVLLAIALMMELMWASRDGAVRVVLDDSFLTVRLAGQSIARNALDRLAAAGLVKVLPAPTGRPNKSSRDNHSKHRKSLPDSIADLTQHS
jgi:hypothetical protein